MKILPINNQNQISHKAVNKKFFNQAKNEFIKYSPHHNLLPIIGICFATTLTPEILVKLAKKPGLINFG